VRLTSVSDLSRPAEEIADLIDQATQLSQLYDDYVELDPGDGHLRAPGIHASEICGCERKVVYCIQNAPKKGGIRKNWRQRFKFGHAVHDMFQKDFADMAKKSKGRIKFEAEVPVSPKYQAIAAELNIHSSCDGVFTFFDDPILDPVLRIGLEIKTEAPDGYAKLQEPKPEHVEQAHVYMKCLDLPLMYFLYVNKGNQNNTPSIEPFLIRYNPETWATIEARCRKLLKMAADNILPDRKESILCDFCPYAHTCEPNFRKNSGKIVSSANWKTLTRR
jgi:hypothetical protein